ncbi:MAG: diguanylate cyclase domain-containing protein [Candidatus Rokuibacteriota bacterium]
MADAPGPAPRIFAETELRHLLALEVQRCTRYQDFLSLCLVRADYPGAPPAEPDVAIIQRIAEMLRSTDIVGVIGPNIAVLLVHTQDSDAAVISGRIRDQIQRDTFETVPAPGRVALGIGLASFPTDATSDGGLLTHAQARLQAAQAPRRP